MEKGDIVLINFPFTDLSNSKKRPALVLVAKENDVVVAFISTQFKWQENTDLVILPTQKNGLKKRSLIRLSKITTVDRSLLLGILGSIDDEIFLEMNSKLKVLFQL